MPRIAFADESGTTEKPRCYTIGVVSVDQSCLAAFEEMFHRLKKMHGIVGEAKWAKIGTGHGAINFALDWTNMILRSHTATFDAIVVNTSLYHNWSRRNANRELAFYQTYLYLLRHLARREGDIIEVLIDNRDDSYSKRPEAVETVANRMLANLESSGRLQGVRKVRSCDTPGVQIADLLTGAIAAGHRQRLDPHVRLNLGKRLAIKRMASVLGWDDLCYDTYPHPKFNIWHFPTEFRADPETRTVTPVSKVPFVDADTLRRWLTSA